jgi:hypothetical protein
MCLDKDGNLYDSAICKELDNFLIEQEDRLTQDYANQVDFSGVDYEEYLLQKLETHIEQDSDAVKQVKRRMVKKSIYLQCISNGCDRLSDCRVDKPYTELPGGQVAWKNSLAATRNL